MKTITSVACALLLAAIVRDRAVVASASCAGLSTLSVPHATITLAQTVEAGAFTPPDAGTPPRAAGALPAFCRVAATLKPTDDSDIKIEVWLPASGWNG